MTDTALNNPIVTAVQAVKSGNDIAAVSSSNPLPTGLDERTSPMQAAIAGKLFGYKLTAPAVSGRYSAVQIWNPVGSGKILAVFSANGWNSTGTMTWSRVKQTRALTTASGEALNKRFGSSNAFVGELRYGDLAALDTVNVFGTLSIAVAVGLGTGTFSGYLIVLEEGQALEFQGNTQNVGMSIIGDIIQF